MSRIGNKAITIPAGVEVTVSEGNEVTVKGPKGTLTRQFSSLMEIEQNAGIITVKRPNDEKHTKQLHGTTRALLHNMVVG
ncbi:MAG: 50S ribosomal protein L6, partial [Erysipelotrichaceae bacterium]|nr:50S ribosomal protein L6 [Erysipelotrichaceae bacterium]